MNILKLIPIRTTKMERGRNYSHLSGHREEMGAVRKSPNCRYNRNRRMWTPMGANIRVMTDGLPNIQWEMTRGDIVPLNDIVNQCEIDPTPEKETVRTMPSIQTKYQSARKNAVGLTEVGNRNPQNNIKAASNDSRMRKCARDQW